MVVVCLSPDAEAHLKGYLETAADCIYTIEHSPTALEDLRAVGCLKTAPVQTVLVLEAVIVLLSPKHAFSGPNPSVFGASWQASHRLLLLPPPELARRLREVRSYSVQCVSLPSPHSPLCPLFSRCVKREACVSACCVCCVPCVCRVCAVCGVCCVWCVLCVCCVCAVCVLCVLCVLWMLCAVCVPPWRWWPRSRWTLRPSLRTTSTHCCDT